jgi:alpha-mannosidase
MGGWLLQPDCYMPSGEALVRQILAGRAYFTLQESGKI